ncbi:MAG TPA: alpha-glucan family phosphorylase [Caldilineaceae bacterium]|nr:alpha-glucan family phosphorylase [Caldilineaceae bacterium]
MNGRYARIAVLPIIPPAIERLEELAYNLWWSWEPDAQALYARLDPALWEATSHNPVRLLHQVSQEKLNAAAEDPDYLAAYHAVLDAFDRYMDPNADTWYRRTYGTGDGSVLAASLQNAEGRDEGAHTDAASASQRPTATSQRSVIAYFSAEFGLHEALPIYSGGLGILSGDHCKAASDLGLPLIGVGFLYPQGYFTQRIDPQGQQQAEYEKIDFAEAPARPALDPNGQELLISVELPGRVVYAKIWCIQVGRVPVYLMDTDVPRNAPQDRELSARLYGGDREMRISQEIVLGIGGVRAVFALGYEPAVWHMNEGHSAFLGLERVRRKVQEEGLSFEEAVEAVRANTLFTTHTPVPAGNDAFAFELVDKFFWQYWEQLGLDRERFIQFARQELPWGPQYSMTVLALRLSAYANGVSELHGQVSRAMWRFLWPDTPVDEVPIGAITNGVHTQTWLAPRLRALYSRYLAPDWEEHIEEAETWAAIERIPDQELWAVHNQCKEDMVRLVRSRVKRQALRHGEGPQRLALADHLLNPHALTIGFARRFATYKRATLLFHDIERLKRILNDPQRPVQIIFSGKAHPDDEPGKALIRQVYEYSQDPDFRGKIVFVENYDMNIARHLISGVDLWLNTPRRPREASGTSGQKAALSGIPNFSILDGWWAEGYNGANGWAIGQEQELNDSDAQDEADAYDLYSTLEEVIIPLFFNRDAATGIPQGWLQVMKNAIRSCASRFSMRRMVIEYTERYYLPAAKSGQRYSRDHFAVARQMAAWKAGLRERWPGVRIERLPLSVHQVKVGEPVPVEAKVWLDGIPEDEVAVEIVTGREAEDGELTVPQPQPMQPAGREGDALRYRGEFRPQTSGPVALAVRVRPKHPDQLHRVEPGLVKWG